MLDCDQRVISLFQDCHELKGGEPSPDLQLRKSPMKPAENARVIACNKENLVTLQVFRLRLSMAIKCSPGATRTLNDLSLRGYCGM
jgi:hypothetical protein